MTAAIDEPQQLTAVLDEIRRVTEVDVAFGGFADTHTSQVVLESVVGSITSALHGLAIGEGRGLGGKALAMRQPTYVLDYQQAKGITHHYDRAVAAERLRSVFAVPIAMSASRVGLIYGAVRGPTPIGERTLRRACAVVGAAQDTMRAATQEMVRAATQETVRTAAQGAREPAATGGGQRDSIRMRQQLRDAHADLTVIINSVSQPAPRKMIKDLLARLSTQTADDDPRACETAGAPAGPLTPREIDVLSLVAAGYSNSEIAAELQLGLATVKAYLRCACRKLGAGNRVEAVVIASRRGLLP